MPENSHINAVVASADETWSNRVIRALAEVGCKSSLFKDGLSAVNELRRQPYDVAVADASIPDLGLIEFCFHIRDLHGRKPVVLISGKGLEAHKRRFRNIRVYANSDRTGVLEQVPDAVEEARRNSDA